MSRKLLYYLIYAFSMLRSCFAQPVWKWQNPLPQGNSPWGVTFGNNHFLAILGNYCTILISPDSATCTERSNATNNFLKLISKIVLIFIGFTVLTSYSDQWDVIPESNFRLGSGLGILSIKVEDTGGSQNKYFLKMGDIK